MAVHHGPSRHRAGEGQTGFIRPFELPEHVRSAATKAKGATGARNTPRLPGGQGQRVCQRNPFWHTCCDGLPRAAFGRLPEHPVPR